MHVKDRQLVQDKYWQIKSPSSERDNHRKGRVAWNTYYVTMVRSVACKPFLKIVN